MLTRYPEQTTQEAPRCNASLPPVVRRYWVAFVCLELVACAIALYFRYVRHCLYYPYGNPIFFRVNRDVDLMCAARQFQHFRQPSFWAPSVSPLVYPAPMALVYELIFGLGAHPVWVFRLIILIAVAVAAYGFSRALIRRGITKTEAWAFTVSALVFSYPFQIVGWLLNLEIVVWMVLAIGIWAYIKEKTWLAAACFGIAGSMKFFPLIYLGLPLAKRQYKQVLWGVLVFCVSLPLCTWILGPTFRMALEGQKSGLEFLRRDYILAFNRGDNGINHAILGLLKVILWQSHRMAHIEPVYRVYLLLAAITGLLLYVFRIRLLPRINQILLLAIASVLLPPISHDYTLIHLYAPLALLILYIVDHRRSYPPQIRIMLGCFAILCASQAYLRLDGVVIGGQLKAVVLIVLFALALMYPVPEIESITGPQSA